MAKVNFNIRRVVNIVHGEALNNLGVAGNVIRDLAKSYTPVGKIRRTGGKQDWQNRTPGAARATIRVITKNNNVRIYGGSRKVFYFYFIEKGTKHSKVYAPFAKALHTVSSRIKNIVQTGQAA